MAIHGKTKHCLSNGAKGAMGAELRTDSVFSFPVFISFLHVQCRLIRGVLVVGYIYSKAKRLFLNDAEGTDG